MDFEIKEFILKILKKPYLAIAATVLACFLMFSPGEFYAGEEVDLIPLSDKQAHFLMFAGVAFLWMFYFENFKKVFLVMMLFALLSECIQAILPASFMRSFDWMDFLADTGGLILGILIAHGLNFRLF